MEKIVASFLDHERNLRFVGQDGTIMLVEPEDPPPPAEEDYHWFRDGEGLEISGGKVSLTKKVKSAQAVYRSGTFSGYVILDKSSPDRVGPVMIRPSRKFIPFKFPGLASGPGLIYGSGWYANKVFKDAVPALVEWWNYALTFKVPDPNDSGRLRRVTKGYPTNWENYGLFLSWTIAVP